MKRHAAIMGPKFRCVLEGLDREIAPLGHRLLAPSQGRLLRLPQRHARHRQADAGAVQGGGRHHDRRRRHLPLTARTPRTAISASPLSASLWRELEQAVEVLCTCLKLAALEKLGV